MYRIARRHNNCIGRHPWRQCSSGVVVWGVVSVGKRCDFLKVKRPSLSLTSEWEIFRTPEVEMMRVFDRSETTKP